MPTCVVVKEPGLTPGNRVEIRGYIPPHCQSFAINLGENAENLLLHFTARFNLLGDVHKIVCNSKEDNAWGAEQREDFFPFQQGAETTISFEYQADRIYGTVYPGYKFSFPVRMNLHEIPYISLEDLVLMSITM